MAAQTRIYHVTVGDTVRLVRASHPSHAVQHVARELIACRVASQDDLLDAIKAGAFLETTLHEQAELPTT
jgi:hypothetical protein